MAYRFLLCFFVCLFIGSNALHCQPYNAEVIEYSSLCRVDNNKLTLTDTVTIQINNRAGDKYTNIAIPYSKKDKISNLEAWIEDIKGNKIRDLKKSDISDQSAISDITFYEDNFTKSFQLKHNIYPYRITYTYQISPKNYMMVCWWTPQVNEDLATKKAKLTVILPKDYRFSKSVNNISDFTCDSTTANLSMVWKTSCAKITEPEIYSQPENFMPRVIIMPLEFDYDISGCSKDWISYGNWQYNLLENLNTLPDNEKATITKLTAAVKDKKEIVKILYHYLQDNCRYINVSIGTGGLKPYPASYVAMNKYGDCKALTNYMKAMLDYVNIESFYTNINASDLPEPVIKALPGPQFNHVILAVPLDKDTLFLENTVNTNPFGYVGTSTQNRDALLVSKDNSKLIRIPALLARDCYNSYKIDVDLTPRESAQATVHGYFKGFNFEIFNQVNDELNKEQKDHIFRNYLPFNNYEVNDCKLIRQHRDSAKIELIAQLNFAQILKSLGKEYYFSVFPLPIPSFTIPEKRHFPVTLPYPILKSDTLIYHLPAGYDLKTQVDTISIKTCFGNYSRKLCKTDGSIHIVKQVELYPGSYTKEQYPEFYAFIKDITKKEQLTLVLKPNP